MKVILKRGEDGTFIADPVHTYQVGLYGYGPTADAAVEDLRQVIEEAREFCPSLPSDISLEVEYEVQSFLLEYAKYFSLAGLERVTGVHQKQLSHYLNGNSRPTKATAAKIQRAVKTFSDTLSSVHLVL